MHRHSRNLGRNIIVINPLGPMFTVSCVHVRAHTQVIRGAHTRKLGAHTNGFRTYSKQVTPNSDEFW